MRKRQEIRRIAASIMAAVMMVTAVPFGGAAYGNEVPRGIVNTEDTETLTASDSNSEHKKNSDSNADAKIEMEAAKRGADCALLMRKPLLRDLEKKMIPMSLKVLRTGSR